MAQAAGGGGGADADVRQFLRVGAEVHQRVGDEDGVAAVPEHEGQAEGDGAGGGIDDVADIGEADGGGAGEAGDHGIRVAGGDHAGGKHVAVLVDHALAVSGQVALALEAGVEEFGVFGVAAGEAGVVDFDAVGVAEAEGGHGGAHAVFAADQHGGAVAGVAEGDGGADDLFLLALGEDHAAGVGADGFADAIERVGGGIEPAGEFAGVAAQVADGFAGDA